MIPSIGRTVHYHAAQGPQAAIITAVSSNGSVTLTVFYTDKTLVGVITTQGSKIGQWDWPPRL